MTLISPFRADPRIRLEFILFRFAAAFMILYAAILTLAPAVRVHSWQAEYPWQHWLGLAAWLAGFGLVIREANRRLPERDSYLLPVVALLIGWGLMTIWRLDSNLGMRQTLWMMIGILVIIMAMRIQGLLGLLRRYKYIWLFTGLLLTLSTFFFGSYPGGEGPRLWLGCCGVYLQPSEPLKFLLIAYLAAYLADRLPFQWSLPHLLAPTLILASIAALLLIAQRDLGTATLIIVLYSLIIFLASGKRRVLVFAFLVILAAGIAGYATFDVIRLRVDSWLNPWLDPSGASYQIVQSLISIASGRILGTGPGLGSPTLVPVAHSDFIATAISEETGFLGTSALILLYCLLFLRGLLISIRAQVSYQRFLAGGLSGYFAGQAIFILGGNLRLLPLTGVTLPFVSYGGSSLITTVFSAAILLIISARPNGQPAAVLKPHSYRLTAVLGLLGFLALTLMSGWWSVIRSENLQFRPDNLRWTINERYVQRGSLLDRNNQPIAISEGIPGAYQRMLLYPDLGNTIGYNHPIYGKSSLEASLDGYLTGIQGNPSSLIVRNEVIYSQPPPGLDVRLSLDLAIQSAADALLTNQTGALVLLNASSGEIMALASYPSYDPNQIDEKYEAWQADAGAPLLNRATQGSYPPGPALGPFLYSMVSASTSLPPIPVYLSATHAGGLLTCAETPEEPMNWESVIRSGCPGAVNELAQILEPVKVREMFRALGFYDSPDIDLPVAETTTDSAITDLTALVTSGGDFRVSPLQMALAAAAVTNEGRLPAPLLAEAVRTPNQGWVVLPSALSKQVFTDPGISAAFADLAGSGNLYWSSTSRAQSSNGAVTWFIGGTIPDWRGASLAVALIIEQDNPQLAKTIGQAILQAAMTPQ